MGQKTYEHLYDTKEEAQEQANNASQHGVRGYSEVYWNGGPREVKMTDGTTKWEVSFKMFYG